MRKLPLLLGLLLPLVGFGQTASPLPAEISAADHGQTKSYIIAADEIARQQEDGRFQVQPENVAKAVKDKIIASDTRLVLYPAKGPRNEATRRLLTEKIMVQLQPGTDVAALANRLGITKWEPAAALPEHYIFSTTSANASLKTLAPLRAEAGVVSAEYLLARMQKRRGRPNDPLFSQQWHLYNTGQHGGLRGIDAGVVGIWGSFSGSGIRGRGVLIGIVDDGVQFTHPDIKPNYDTTRDYDWNDSTHYDARPSQYNGDFHGTSVAGVAAARGGNRTGVCGVAPQARLTGLRLIADYVDDNTEAQAFLYRSSQIAIKNNSWGPDDDGQTMEAPGPIATQALEDATNSGRGGLGTIFVWAAGNGREEGDNSNYDGYANSIHTIAVTAISNRGRATYYAEGGANILIGAPSDNYTSSGIVTTDLTGSNGYNYSGARGELSDRNYTKTFGGTSSAAPVISGVAALMLQRNPRLGWRDVQEILIRTARQNDAGNPGWITNGAGFHFNQDYGAGLVSGGGAVRLAANWTNLGPQTEQSQSNSIPQSIPDGSGSVTRPFVFTTEQRVEHVTVKLDITHPSRGQLRIRLTSPAGTVSELASPHGDGNNDIDWTYMTVRNWGESAVGTWTLTIEDLTAGSSGTLNNATVTLFGTDAPLAN
ncbi:MAG: S8 family peptidase [Chthoniobacterales bacterium]